MVRDGYLRVSADVVYTELLFSVVVARVVVGDSEFADGVCVQSGLVVERTVPLVAEAAVLKGVNVGVVNSGPWYEVVKLVCGVWPRAKEGFECGGRQSVVLSSFRGDKILLIASNGRCR
jgi:hypothetical protein